MNNDCAESKFVPDKILRIILSAVLTLAILPITAMQAFAAPTSPAAPTAALTAAPTPTAAPADGVVTKLNIDGYDKDIYYVVNPSGSHGGGSDERTHAEITIPGGSNGDALNIAGTNVYYLIPGVTSADLSKQTLEKETFYGSSKMTWLEYWKGEGLTPSTLTDVSSKEADSETGGHAASTGYYDLGGFDAVARPTIEYGIAHFSYQYIQKFHGIDEDSSDFIDDFAYFAQRTPAIDGSGTGTTTTIAHNNIIPAWATEGEAAVTSWDSSSRKYKTTASDETEWYMENYRVEGFQRIPVKVNAELYIENMVLIEAKATAAKLAFANFTIGGQDGAGDVVNEATGGLKTLNANGTYSKQALGVSTVGYNLESRGHSFDFNYSWGDYADAYIFLSKTTDDLPDKFENGKTGTTLSSDEYNDYKIKFLGAKYEYYGESNKSGSGTPIYTYGTTPGADTWYSPDKKSGGRIELGFNFDSLRLGGSGTNTTADGIYNKGGAKGKTGWYRVTLYAAGYNDVSTMVYIPKQATNPSISLSSDLKKLYLTDIDDVLKAELAAGTANVVLQSVSGRSATTVEGFDGTKIAPDGSYDISNLTLDPDSDYRINITSDSLATINTANLTGHTSDNSAATISTAKTATKLFVGEGETLAATANPAGTIVWSSADEKIASVDAKGKVTAKGAGSTIIYATANGKTASIAMTVESKIALNKKAATIYTKGSASLTKVTLKATVAGSNQAVTWKSSDDKIASVAGGVVTAKKAGRATITASANGKSASASITVKASSLTLTKAAASIKKGKKVSIKAKATPSAAITYKSNNKNVSVTKKGVVKGLKKGSSKITVTANGIKKVFKVKVK